MTQNTSRDCPPSPHWFRKHHHDGQGEFRCLSGTYGTTVNSSTRKPSERPLPSFGHDLGAGGDVVVLMLRAQEVAIQLASTVGALVGAVRVNHVHRPVRPDWWDWSEWCHRCRTGATGSRSLAWRVNSPKPLAPNLRETAMENDVPFDLWFVLGDALRLTPRASDRLADEALGVSLVFCRDHELGSDWNILSEKNKQ